MVGERVECMADFKPLFLRYLCQAGYNMFVNLAAIEFIVVKVSIIGIEAP